MRAKHSIERNRKQSARMLGIPLSESAKAKLRGVDHRQFPPHCIRCVNREANDCVKHNLSCFKARETECFKRDCRRVVHPDYRKATGGK